MTTTTVIPAQSTLQRLPDWLGANLNQSEGEILGLGTRRAGSPAPSHCTNPDRFLMNSLTPTVWANCQFTWSNPLTPSSNSSPHAGRGTRPPTRNCSYPPATWSARSPRCRAHPSGGNHLLHAAVQTTVRGRQCEVLRESVSSTSIARREAEGGATGLPAGAPIRSLGIACAPPTSGGVGMTL